MPLRSASGARYGIPWTLLAGIGTVESGNGQSTAPGVHSGTNAYGAAGPMQFGHRRRGREHLGRRPRPPARPEAGSAMHDLLEKCLQDGPDVTVTLTRTDTLLFSEDPGKTASIANQVIISIKELVAAAAGPPVSGRIPIPELGLTAMVHDGGPVSGPGMRVTYEPSPAPTAGGSLPGSAGWAAAMASRAWAHMDTTVWRWKECHSRTWCWARPACPFPWAKHSSAISSLRP